MSGPRIRTADGFDVIHGQRVFNYYDLKWGVLDTSDVDPAWEELVERQAERYGDRYDGPWFHVNHDDGTRALLNGDRISTANLTGMGER